MKSYIILASILLSLPSNPSEENRFPSLSSTASRPVPIPSSSAGSSPHIDKGLSQSPQLEDYFDNPLKSAPKVEVPRKVIFEPHLRRIEEDFIRQMTFKIRVRKHTTEDNCIKITIEGFLKDKRMMKQTVDIEY